MGVEKFLQANELTLTSPCSWYCFYWISLKLKWCWHLRIFKSPAQWSDLGASSGEKTYCKQFLDVYPCLRKSHISVWYRLWRHKQHIISQFNFMLVELFKCYRLGLISTKLKDLRTFSLKGQSPIVIIVRYEVTQTLFFESPVVFFCEEEWETCEHEVSLLSVYVLCAFSCTREQREKCVTLL